MSFSFDLSKYRKQDPREYADYLDDEFDYEYGDEFYFEDEDYSDDIYDI